MRTNIIFFGIALGLITTLMGQLPPLDEYGRPITPTPAPEEETPEKNVKASALQSVIFSALPLAPVKDLILPKEVDLQFQNVGEMDKIEGAVIKAIEESELEILFNVRALTSAKIAQTLVNQKKKGRIVVGIMEEKPEGISRYNAPNFFMVNNLPIFFNPPKVLNSNNYLIIDRKRVLISSMDWTSTGGSSTGNIILIEDPGIVIDYYNAWVAQLNNSVVPPITQSVLKLLTQ